MGCAHVRRELTELTLKRERDARTREKAEELYMLVLKLRHEARAWCNAAVTDDFSHLDPDFKLPGYEKDRIRLLCDLYIPVLSAAARELMDVYIDFGSHAFERLAPGSENRSFPVNYAGELETKFGLLEARIEELRKQLSRAVGGATET